MIKKRFVSYFDKEHNYIIQDLQNEDEYQVGFANCDEDVFLELVNQLSKENEWLFKCVENQSALINMLDSRIMEYNMEHKITIKLTEKDLKTLDKALSYYTHQKVEE